MHCKSDLLDEDALAKWKETHARRRRSRRRAAREAATEAEGQSESETQHL